MLKIKNSGESSKKPRINITTRRPSRKEVIIPMAKRIAELIVNLAHTHISNINKCLKSSNHKQWNHHHNQQASKQFQFINN